MNFYIINNFHKFVLFIRGIMKSAFFLENKNIFNSINNVLDIKTSKRFNKTINKQPTKTTIYVSKVLVQIRQHPLCNMCNFIKFNKVKNIVAHLDIVLILILCITKSIWSCLKFLPNIFTILNNYITSLS